jgi:hypothetical protein
MLLVSYYFIQYFTANQVDGLLFERVANFVIVQAEGLGFTVKWDTKVRRKDV